MGKLDKLLDIPINELTESEKWQIRVLLVLDFAHFWAADSLYLLKTRIWNARLLLWWYQLYIRLDEFDVSLEFDGAAWRVMSKKRRYQYARDLAVRRRIAHTRNRCGIENNWRLVIEDIINHIMPSMDYEMARKDVEQNKSINILWHVMRKRKGDLDGEKE